MAGRNRDRQRINRQRAAAIAAAEARRQQARRRLVVGGIGGVVLLAALIVVILLVRSGGDDTDLAATSTTALDEATTTTAGASAAGKPCVALADPLPAGAPAVPIEVGPPPAQLITKDLREGTGATVAKTDSVSAKYTGVSCSTGKIFDSSYARGADPVTFPLSNVIKGWQDGIPGMKVGGMRLLGIPADQAYGKPGRPGTILPDEALWFVVEVVETKPA